MAMRQPHAPACLTCVKLDATHRKMVSVPISNAHLPIARWICEDERLIPFGEGRSRSGAASSIVRRTTKAPQFTG